MSHPLLQLPNHEQWAILQWATGRPRSWFAAREPARWWASLLLGEAALIERLAVNRLGGRPLAQLLGHREFYGRRFWVTPDALIPRSETEGLVDLGLGCLKAGDPAQDPPQKTVLDLGTGTGCVGLTLALEQPGIDLTLTDQSPEALSLARLNATWLGVPSRCCLGRWFEAVAADQPSPRGRYDLIVANPPYVAAGDPHLTRGDLRYEPRAALEGLHPDAKGLGDLTEILKAAPAWLTPNGWLVVEHGHDQQAAVMAMAQQAGFVHVSGEADLSGRPRFVKAQLS